MRLVCIFLSIIPFTCFSQWNQQGDNYTSGSVTAASIISTSNLGLVLNPGDNGNAIIRRSNPGNLILSSNGGASEIRFNYNYGGGSGGISIFDGGISSYANLRVTSDGHLIISASGGLIGIDNDNPKSSLDLNGSFQIYPAKDAGTIGALKLRIISGASASVLEANSDYIWEDHDIIINAASSLGGNVNQLVVHKTGNIGIGTRSIDAKLTVNGDIHAREVRIDMDGSIAPDYVFRKDYRLTTLADLEAFIVKHKHLPEVPSAEEMKVQGLHLKEMNLILLKKLEEMTLHLIDQYKTVRRQQEQIDSLLRKTQQLEKLFLINKTEFEKRQR